MKRAFCAIGMFAALLFLQAGVATAGTLHGTVKNGTTGKSAAGVQLILLELKSGMQPVANAKSDAQGQFTLENAGIGAQPMLLRAVFNDINFHQPVPPGKTEVDITVYESTKDPKTISVISRIVFFQPNRAMLTVGEEFAVQNNSQPPKAFFQPGGNFEFKIPENAKLQQVAASGSAGMPVVQAPIDKTGGKYAVAYAFRPGESTIRYSYELPYAGNAARVPVESPYGAGRLLVVAPPTMQISGAELQPGGQEQGMNIYGRENVAANTALVVSVSGTAPPPTDTNTPAAQGRDAPEGAGGNIQVVPGRLDVLKWPLIGGFAVLFALGAFLLARKPTAMAVPVGAGGSAAVPAAASMAPSPASQSPSARAQSARTPAANLAEMDAQVGTSLDSLKEKLFRLELRHQAGTISEEEYARERSRAQQVLRDLLRG
ncbi:MAG TPA: hypothetical protein VOA78_11340 [Candidatus Dormibacteraeota bacterium]|nr:hypothetical protein [Candidatus Dormibacteraeota bacterium]